VLIKVRKREKKKGSFWIDFDAACFGYPRRLQATAHVVCWRHPIRSIASELTRFGSLVPAAGCASAAPHPPALLHVWPCKEAGGLLLLATASVTRHGTTTTPARRHDTLLLGLWALRIRDAAELEHSEPRPHVPAHFQSPKHAGHGRWHRDCKFNTTTGSTAQPLSACPAAATGARSPWPTPRRCVPNLIERDGVREGRRKG
jgi:hypothetical protein